MSLENALALVEQVKTLHLMPDDMIFVRVKAARLDQIKQVSEWMQERFPDHKVTVMSEEIDLSVIRKGSPAHEAMQLLGYDGEATP